VKLKNLINFETHAIPALKFQMRYYESYFQRPIAPKRVKCLEAVSCLLAGILVACSTHAAGLSRSSAVFVILMENYNWSDLKRNRTPPILTIRFCRSPPMLSITLIRRAFTRASQITFGLKLELISAFERRSAVDKSSERAVFLQVPAVAEKFCVSIALSSRAANSVFIALDHQLLSEHLGSPH
jgi:hypothetical protein